MGFRVIQNLLLFESRLLTRSREKIDGDKRYWYNFKDIFGSVPAPDSLGVGRTVKFVNNTARTASLKQHDKGASWASVFTIDSSQSVSLTLKDGEESVFIVRGGADTSQITQVPSTSSVLVLWSDGMAAWPSSVGSDSGDLEVYLSSILPIPLPRAVRRSNRGYIDNGKEDKLENIVEEIKLEVDSYV